MPAISNSVWLLETARSDNHSDKPDKALSWKWKFVSSRRLKVNQFLILALDNEITGTGDTPHNS